MSKKTDSLLPSRGWPRLDGLRPASDAVQIALDRDRSTRADEELLTEVRRRCDALTPRERTVMTLVVAGWRNKQIAGKIQTSEATVKVHRTNLMRKMQASSLADLIVMGERLRPPAQELERPQRKQGALNQGLDSLRFFLAHLASV